MTSRASFPHLARVPTRWADNDVYGHLNNVEYYSVFDTVINKWLIEEGGLDIHHGAVIGVCAESHCTFLSALAFPHTIAVALRVGHLGRSSVRYELALFDEDAEQPAATGWFVHVFVDRGSRQPTPVPDPLRAALQRLVVPTPAT